ncbi:MAG TPA: hypothetical protein VK348_08380 [Planctomycetota bacterium]|nr:hypothetical protein [Planctomycetota bacterium]
MTEPAGATITADGELRLSDHIGTVEVGKDADLVLVAGDPVALGRGSLRRPWFQRRHEPA